MKEETMLSFTAHHDDARRTERLEQRLSPSAKEVIEHAAALQGVTPSEFARSHTIRAAQETISRMEVTRLSTEDRKAFLRAFDDAQPNEALIGILDIHAQLTERAPERA